MESSILRLMPALLVVAVVADARLSWRAMAAKKAGTRSPPVAVMSTVEVEEAEAEAPSEAENCVTVEARLAA